jgi:hypothetical protein
VRIDNRFAIFISSSMVELASERNAVWAGMAASDTWRPFAYEKDALASSKGARENWEKQLAGTDATVVLLWKEVGQWTKKEISYSLEQGFPVLVFIKQDEDKPLQRNEGAFLANLENPDTGLAPKYFASTEDLVGFVKESLQAEFLAGFRESLLSPDGELQGNRRAGIPTENGTSVREAAGPTVTPRKPDDLRRLRKNPRSRKFIGRSREERRLMREIENHEPLVVVVGPPGIGKKELLRDLTWNGEFGPDYEDGVAVHPHKADSANLEDLLQAIWEEFYETPDPGVVLPSQRNRELANKKALIFLPDVGLPPDRIEELFEEMQDAVFCVTAEDWPEQGTRVSLRGFSDPTEVLGVFENGYRDQVPAEAREDILTVCGLLDGNPGLIDLLARRAADEADYFPDEDDVHPLPAWAAARREMTAAELRDWLVPPEQQRVVAVLRETGVHTPRAVVADIAGSEQAIDDTVAQGLANAASPRYQVNAALARGHDAGDNALMGRILASTLVWADKAGPTEIYEDRAFVLRMLEWGADQQRWDEVLRLGKATETPMALGGRHGAWEQVLEHSRNAARLMEPPDQAAEAWALHQLGSRALLRDDLGDARVLLHESLRRTPEGDDEGAAITRNNLGLVPAAIVSGGVLLLLLVFLVTWVPALALGAAPFEPELGVAFEEAVPAPATELVVQPTKPFQVAGNEDVVVTVAVVDQNLDGESAGDAGFCIVADGACVSDASGSGITTPNVRGSTGFDAAPVPGQPLALAAAIESPCEIEAGDGTVKAIVPADEACYLEIGFRPLVAGTHEATLSLRTEGSEYEGTLRGEATPAPIPISEIDREIARFAGAGDEKPFKIRNVGTASFGIGPIQPKLPQGFSLGKDECSDRSLAPTDPSCEFVVIYQGGEHGTLLELDLRSEIGVVAGDDAILLLVAEGS